MSLAENNQVLHQPQQTGFGFATTATNGPQVTIYPPPEHCTGAHHEYIVQADNTDYQFQQVPDHYGSQEPVPAADSCSASYIAGFDRLTATVNYVDPERIGHHEQLSAIRSVQNGLSVTQTTNENWHNQETPIKFTPPVAARLDLCGNEAINETETQSNNELVWHNCEPHDQMRQCPSRSISRGSGSGTGKAPPEKIIQRVKANKKERRRTQSINQAFNELRHHIPDVPRDTKLSKIKTLRLAISYISHLSTSLEADPNNLNSNQHSNKTTTDNLLNIRTGKGSSGPQLVELVSATDKHSRPESELHTNQTQYLKCYLNDGVSKLVAQSQPRTSKDRKHRTGWPEIVWKLSPGDIVGISNSNGGQKQRLTEMTAKAKNK